MSTSLGSWLPKALRRSPAAWATAASIAAVSSATLWCAGESRGVRPGGAARTAAAPPLMESPAPAAGLPAAFVGSDACASCHEREYRAWQGSHHSRAMQHATAASVLGDFRGARLAYAGNTHRFERKNDTYWVTTDGPDGRLQSYRVLYTFGLEPLQQYLVALPGGRLQALPFAWDSRPKRDGGQRWYHLHAGERVRSGDVLHWTAPSQNWNHMCAECHSTHVTKGYDAAADHFATTSSEIAVGCEACHGGGARHVAWAKAPGADAAKGLDVRLDERQDATWTRLPSGTSLRSKAQSSGTETAVCAPCHSRRESLMQPLRHGAPLLDSIAPELLTEPFHDADGVMKEEVFTYSTFVQSKMAMLGVTCSDCHDAHSGGLRAEGNAVCTRCHDAAGYDGPRHHRHGERARVHSAPPSCVECHMPARTYMGIDVRHDHGFRVPRPDLSMRFGTSNACSDCHADRSAQWAAETLEMWLGRPARSFQKYTDVFAGARAGDPSVVEALRALALDRATPNIARATALSYLRNAPDAASLLVLRQALGEVDPTLRRAALSALESHAPRDVAAAAVPLLGDPVLAVRTEAARVLAGTSADVLPSAAPAELEQALREYIATQSLNADRAEAQNNLGLVFSRTGDAPAAERAYTRALRIEPGYVPSYVNLADLYRTLGRDAEGVALLRRGSARHVDNAELLHSLGLALVRRGRKDEALDALRRAVLLAPGNARFEYVYAAALARPRQHEDSGARP